MNRESAVKSLKAGKKITHTCFQEYEYIKLTGNRIVDENGINIGSVESFVDGTDMAYPNEWRVLS